MKKMIRSLAVAACLAAGICVGANPAQAQNKPKQNTTTESHSGQHQMKSKSDKSSMNSSRKGMKDGMAKDDAEFLRKAYEGGLAEISLARLAAEKASSNKVKAYAQEMIDEHTMANQMIAAMISGQGASDQMASGNAGNASSGGAMGAGSGTAAGTGTGTSGNVSSGTSGATDPATGAGTGTSGSTGATGSSSSAAGNAGVGATDANTSGTGATGNDPSQATGNNANTSTGVAGTSVMGTDRASTPNNDNGLPSGNSGMVGQNNALANVTVSPEVKAKEAYILSTDLNEEHKALEAKLSGLSGEEFDRQYMKAMVKDHTKMLNMVEAKANEAKEADEPSAAQAWAKQHLPIIKQHKERAEKLAQSETGMNKK
jgi:predicted outer membrane protein